MYLNHCSQLKREKFLHFRLPRLRWGETKTINILNINIIARNRLRYNLQKIKILRNIQVNFSLYCLYPFCGNVYSYIKAPIKQHIPRFMQGIHTFSAPGRAEAAGAPVGESKLVAFGEYRQENGQYNELRDTVAVPETA